MSVLFSENHWLLCPAFKIEHLYALSWRSFLSTVAVWMSGPVNGFSEGSPCVESVENPLLVAERAESAILRL